MILRIESTIERKQYSSMIDIAKSGDQSIGGTELRGRARLVRLVGRSGGVVALSVGVLVAVILATSIGSIPISPWHTAGILLNATHLVHITPHWSDIEERILLQLRLPRVLGAALVGMALSVAGTLFQGLLRNPLADPLLLGTSSGAALGATIGILVPGLVVISWLSFSVVALLAFVGALLAAALVYRLATRQGQTPVVTLLLAGVAVSAMLAGVQTLIITFTPHNDSRLAALTSWIAGEINVRNWLQVQVEAVPIIACCLGAVLLAPVLDALALGEEMAAHLGLTIGRYKLIIVALAAMLVALAVAMSGLVGFVGLVAPHVCRLIFGPAHRLLLPTTALVGAIFVVMADMLARSLAAPIEIPLGVVTALVGGPFFLALLSNAGQRYGW